MSELIKACAVIGVGLALVYGGAAEMLGWLRGRARLRRVTGVVVGHVSPGAAGPANPSRSARIQFTADDGRVVEVVSSAWSYPGPSVGEHVPVLYDPADPEGSADRAGTRVLKAVLFSPLLIAAGAGLAIFGLTLL